MKKTVGCFSFVLHSHLPYVLFHGEWPHGTDWLFEAAAETYVPILNMVRRLADRGILPKLTVGITPILAEQLSSPIFQFGFIDYLLQKIETSQIDERDFSRKGETHMAFLAGWWRDYYTNIYESYVNRFEKNILGEFRKLMDEGAIEVITCAATHGYLPLLGYDEAVRAQVAHGVITYRRHFGRDPKGMWLPECAYRPGYFWEFPVEGAGAGYQRKGIEEILYDNGLSYFIVDSHLLEGGKAIGAYLDRFEALREMWDRFMAEFPETVVDEPRLPYEPYAISSAGNHKTASIFTRDPKTAIVVWSGEHGYPGDGSYLDFHKKHFPGGNRYWRVTGPKVDLGEKQVYDPDVVKGRLAENADHFVSLVKETLTSYHSEFGRPGIVTAPYDTELFGHWWFEGIEFIENVLNGIARDGTIELITLSEYHDRFPPRKVVAIPEGSWGEGGFHWIWFNDWTRWTWKHIYEAEKKMIEMANAHAETKNHDLLRVLSQLGRELLLMESSDWQFLISTWSARDYAEMRFSEHYADFERLFSLAVRLSEGKELDTGDWEFLGDIEKRDNPFPTIDISLWKS